ncbi:MAG: PEGA domain-containing protein [Proteobacteria bacterium]|nr:PEGA domain-containing protein [Pseudomonadota bacterium]
MILLRQLVAILALLAWLAGTAAANAAPRLALAQGNRLFAAGDYGAAFEVFSQAQRRWPRPVFLRSMAFCQLKRARHREALELLRQYAAAFPRARDAVKVAATIAELDLAMATQLKVTSTPPGAAVFVDTEASGQRGTTPYAGPLAPGPHTLILRHPGFATTTREFVLRPRQALTLEVPLEVGLHVTSVPSGAVAYLSAPDATAAAVRRTPALGQTPFHGTLALGRHALWLLHPDRRPFKALLQADGPGALALHAVLRVGLRVESLPAGATLRLDGQPVAGRTPLELETTPGEHQLEVEHADYQPLQQSVRVVAGPNASRVQVALRGGLLSMRSQPSGAELLLDGEPLGLTPLADLNVPLGAHRLALRHSGKSGWRKTLRLLPNEALSAEVKLGRPRWPAWLGASLAAVGLIAGTTAGLIAWRRVDDANHATRYDPTGAAAGRGYCRGGGAPYRGLYKDAATTLPITGDDCGLATQHLATASLAGAGLAALFAATYYYWFARPVARVERHPRSGRPPAAVGARPAASTPTPQPPPREPATKVP